MAIVVTEDNFVRAETNRMLVGLQPMQAGSTDGNTTANRYQWMSKR